MLLQTVHLFGHLSISPPYLPVKRDLRYGSDPVSITYMYNPSNYPKQESNELLIEKKKVYVNKHIIYSIISM